MCAAKLHLTNNNNNTFFKAELGNEWSSQTLASEEKATTASLGQLVSLHGVLFNNSITIVLCSDDARCSGQEASEENASHLPDHAALQTLQDALLHSLDR